MPQPPPLADVVVVYGAPGCHLCEAAREVVDAHLAARRSRGLEAPPVAERDIHADERLLLAFLETIPVIEVGPVRLELATSPARIRAFLDGALGTSRGAAPGDPAPGMGGPGSSARA